LRLGFRLAGRRLLDLGLQGAEPVRERSVERLLDRLKVGSLRLPLGDERRVKRGVVFAAGETAKRSEEGERPFDRLVAGQAA